MNDAELVREMQSYFAMQADEVPAPHNQWLCEMRDRLTALADLLQNGVLLSREDAEAAAFLAGQEAWRHDCGDAPGKYREVSYAGLESRIRAMLTASEAK